MCKCIGVVDGHVISETERQFLLSWKAMRRARRRQHRQVSRPSSHRGTSGVAADYLFPSGKSGADPRWRPHGSADPVFPARPPDPAGPACPAAAQGLEEEAAAAATAAPAGDPGLRRHSWIHQIAGNCPEPPHAVGPPTRNSQVPSPHTVGPPASSEASLGDAESHQGDHTQLESQGHRRLRCQHLSNHTASMSPQSLQHMPMPMPWVVA